MDNILLEVNDLNIHFSTKEGVVKAVDGVNLIIERGKTLCLVGESGCGKSVTARAFLKLIAGNGKITGGQILYHRAADDGRRETVDIARLDAKGRDIRSIRGKDIAMIFQEPMTSLSMMHTVGDQIMEVIQLHDQVTKPAARTRAIEMLDLVGIPRPQRLIDEYPFRLSGGMRQRIMIAMALACHPQMLIADEPTTALDVVAQATVLEVLREQVGAGTALVFITHDLAVATSLCERAVVLANGQVIEEGPLPELLWEAEHAYTRELSAAAYAQTLPTSASGWSL